MFSLQRGSFGGKITNMKKKNFFSWYWRVGIKSSFSVEKNLFAFLVRYFSIAELLGTLFSPWKRDVEVAGWEGWRPLKSLGILADNLFSRFIGAGIRLAVATGGIISLLIFFFFSASLLLIWIFPPVIILALKAIYFPFNVVLFTFFLIFYLFALLISHKNSKEDDPEDEDPGQLFKKKWFRRVCERLGIPGENLDKAVIESIGSENFLRNLGMTRKNLEEIMRLEFEENLRIDKKSKFWLKENLDKVPAVGRYWKYAYTVNLNKYSQDLSKFDPTEYSGASLIGRDEELKLADLILSRPSQNNVLITAKPGTGRKTLIHHFARLIRTGNMDGYFNKKRVLVFNLGEAMADSASKGWNIESFLHLMFSEAARAGNVILVIYDLENYLGKESGFNRPDISAIMEEYLPLPNFQVISTSTPGEYHRLIEKHESLAKSFEVVELHEPSPEEALEILFEKLARYEKKRIIFTYPALKYIVDSSGKYNWAVPLPERAIDLAEEVLMHWLANRRTRWILSETVDEFLSLKTGTAMGKIKSDEREKLLNLEKILHRRIIGQDEAVKQVTEALRRARSGINDPKKPVGSFLFFGPTGVGKTETAKALAEAYFGDENKMIRLDMSEFQNPGSLDRIIGSNFLNQPGQFTNQIKDNPFSLVLLDEIEKAHPDILNLFLQILDEGYVTDVFGEKINFRNCIIIATSNAGAVLIQELIKDGKPADAIKETLVNNLVEKGVFKVEFLNRFDGVIFFRPLEDAQLRSVASLMLGRIARRLRKEKNIEVDFEEGILEIIIEKGYNPMFGARSLCRYIEDKVENLIAKKIISGEAKKGETIKISSSDF
jgi:ATP-dependent Clp protease ATP-binding subunit ClpC